MVARPGTWQCQRVAPVTTHQRVDAYWAQMFGLHPDELHTPGVRVLAHRPERAYWRGVYALVLGDAASIFAPNDLVATLSATFADRGAEHALQPDVWHEALGAAAGSVLGPAVHHYVDDGTRLTALAAGRRLNPGDTLSLNALRATVDAGEWEESGFAEHTATIFGLFDSDRLVAAANLSPGPAEASDIGVITRPDERGKGHGTHIAALAAQQAVGMYGVARYRALAFNTASLAIARKLGCWEYGRNVAIQLTG